MKKTGTKTSSTKMPRGSAEFLSIEKVRPHLDTVYPHFAEKHYRKYLIVTNDKYNKQPHSRLYLCYQSQIELMQTYADDALIKMQSNVAQHNMFTRFPDRKDLTWSILIAIIDQGTSRQSALSLIKALGLLYKIFDEENIQFNDMNELSGPHIDVIKKHVQNNGKYLKSSLSDLSLMLRMIIINIQETFLVPDIRQYGTVGSKGIGKTPTHSITWQLDLYAEQAIESLIIRVKKYREWMNELNTIGNLFSLQNLAYTFFENLDKIGSGAGGANIRIRKLAIHLYGVELQCWENYQKIKKHEKVREIELRKLGKNGINITIRDERMFAMWHKVIAPNYPHDKQILSQYAFLFKISLEAWRGNISKAIGINRIIFDTMIYPSFDELYPLYLLVLCRTGVNQGVAQDWRIWKDESDKYHLGIDSGMGRLVDGTKGRGNTEQTVALDRQIRRYVDFYTQWLTPIFEHSGNKHFFQCISNGSKSGKIYTHIDPMTLAQKANRKQGTFYHIYPIIDEVVMPDGTHYEERVMWIKHHKIRKIKNLSDYLSGKDQYKRKMELGHKDLDTEYIYQQTVDFEDVKTHQIATAQNHFLDVVKGNADIENNPRLKIFTTPMSNCKNPKNPTYVGSKKLHSNDVCTNWRKCLTDCEQCEVIAKIHGPIIVAWRDCMDEMREIYTTTELWDRKFYYDYQAAVSTLEGFNTDIMEVCEKKALEYTDFVRRHILNSKRARKLNQEELLNA